VTADEIIARLGLKPHPEGGHYIQTFRAPEGTAIYFLLKGGERSHWHKVTNADEIWHHYAGAPLELSLSEDGKSVRHVRLALIPARKCDNNQRVNFSSVAKIKDWIAHFEAQWDKHLLRLKQQVESDL